MTDPATLRLALDATRTARASLAELEAVLVNALERPFEGGLQGTVQAPAAPAPPASAHRRDHRPGRPAILAEDPELRSFVEVRMGRMTFDQIAAAVADHFPEGRRIGKSALHAWWHTHRKRITAGQSLSQPRT